MYNSNCCSFKIKSTFCPSTMQRRCEGKAPGILNLYCGWRCISHMLDRNHFVFSGEEKYSNAPTEF
jgi:hypothetical protein